MAESYAKRNNSPLDEMDIEDEAYSEDAASLITEEDDEWTKKRKSKTRSKRTRKYLDIEERKRTINFPQ